MCSFQGVKKSEGFRIAVIEQALGVLAAKQPEQDWRQIGIEQRGADQTREDHDGNGVQNLGTWALSFKQQWRQRKGSH